MIGGLFSNIKKDSYKNPLLLKLLCLLFDFIIPVLETTKGPNDGHTKIWAAKG